MIRLGAARFAQYAYPPNELGYCGPPGARAMLAAEATDEIEKRARQFDGAWCYLEVLAEAAGALDPLDARVVDAYWVGGPLLEEVDPAYLVSRLAKRFAGQPGGSWRQATTRASAHHSFQVFEVYPWAGLLLAGRPAAPAVRVLDRCRIRVGEVVAVDGEAAVVSSAPLLWEDRSLHEADPRTERVRWSVAGESLIDRPAVGDLVALHWDWVCDVITPEQARTIREREEQVRAAVGLSSHLP